MQHQNLNVLAEIKRVVQSIEQSLHQLVCTIDEQYLQACTKIAHSQGKLIVTGLGKSGLIGRKIASTMTSLGIPSLFLHATEALHGDMGVIQKHDLLLAISHSGEGDEILQLVSFAKKMQVFIISLTAAASSTLAKFSNLILTTGVTAEACPHNLAPTTSTTVALVIGDALAVTAAKLRNFGPDHYAANHPAGHLGKRLLLTAADLMSTGSNLPKVTINCPMSEVLIEMSNKCLGMTAVLDKHNKLVGSITDGDIRRTVQHYKDHWLHLTAGDIMFSQPRTLTSNTNIEDCINFMRQNRINNIIIVDDDQYIGAFNWNTLSQKGLV